MERIQRNYSIMILGKVEKGAVLDREAQNLVDIKSLNLFKDDQVYTALMHVL